MEQTAEQYEDRETTASSEKTEKKEKRKRMKLTYRQIKEQMEFYFSTANLQKDRFLRKVVEGRSDGFIPLAEFLKFNKITNFTEDVSIIAKAIEDSSELVLSEDRTRVKRTTPYIEPTDTDERTVYVEGLPGATTHEWVNQAFKACGRVLYVSLPRYQSTGDVKGFAFVEFETKEQAQKACETLGTGAFKDVGKFPKYNKEIKQLSRKLKKHGADPKSTDGEESQITTEASTKGPGKGVEEKKRKRKRKSRTGDSTDAKANPEAGEVSESGTEQVVDQSSQETEGRDKGEGKKKEERSSRRKRKREADVEEKRDASALKNSRDESESEVKEEESTPATSKSTPSGRKRKRDAAEEDGKDQSAKRARRDGDKTGDKEKDIDGGTEEEDAGEKEGRKRRRKKHNAVENLPKLKVIPKQEWLVLRKKFLSTQRKNMGALKKQLTKCEKKMRKEEKKARGAEKTVEGEGKEGSQKDGETKQGEKGAAPPIEFTAGVIVRINSENPLFRKEIKKQVSAVAEPAYVDCVDGKKEAFLRCKTGHDAGAIVSAGLDHHSLVLLTGEEEQVYWSILQQQRQDKRQQKTKKPRGVDRLERRANVIHNMQLKKNTRVVFTDDAD